MYKVFYSGGEKSPLLDTAQKNALVAALTLAGNGYKEATYADYLDIVSTGHVFTNHIYIVSDYPEDAEESDNITEITDSIGDSSINIIAAISEITDILENGVNIAGSNKEAFGTAVPANALAISMGVGATYVKVGTPLVAYMSNGATWVTL